MTTAFKEGEEGGPGPGPKISKPISKPPPLFLLLHFHVPLPSLCATAPPIAAAVVLAAATWEGDPRVARHQRGRGNPISGSS